MTEEIKILTQLGTEASQAAIAEYTRYYASATIVWGLLCLVVIIASLWGLSKGMKSPKVEDYDKPWLALALGLVILAFMAGLAENISQALNPKAIAIHRLIKDIRGD